MAKTEFNHIYSSLNDAQRTAVDTIDGPLLVIAGPGTGKTQLLGARVANILLKTDVPARNILCLTFTDNGAENMRQRLTRFIGREAYDVGISTYHGLGGDIIRRFPQYFTETNLQQPIDNLGKHQILSTIVAELSYTNPLKQTQHHIKDLISTISEVKRALLSPQDMRLIAKENIVFINAASPYIETIFSGIVRMPSKLSVALPYFENIYTVLIKNSPKNPYSERYGSLSGVAIQELKLAIDDASDTNSTKSLTAWKNNWLAKTENNTFVITGELENLRMIALADVLEKYETQLESRGLYDFDDMILRSIHALESHDDLRYTLHEQYMYILLDEFQDTNAAQLRLVELLTNNPLYEGRPNVMAVGDDDQAIYAFQGAQYSNMLDFYNLYKNVQVVSLVDNYRSHGSILETAQNLTSQMSARLFTSFHGVSKQLVSKNTKLPKDATIERVSCLSDVAERAYIADRISELLANGVSANEIVILAPKHRILEPLVPYLNNHNIPLQYEKRENILESPLIREILVMARLLNALKSENESAANAYWPELLSNECWKIPISTIWKLSWEVNNGKNDKCWTRLLLESTGTLRSAGLLMTGLAYHTQIESFETILDYLTGNLALATNEEDIPFVKSPIRDVYLQADVNMKDAADFYDMLSQLTVLRTRLREFQKTQDQLLRLDDLLALVDAHEAADEPILHTSPYHQAAEAVQLMTVYKSKGLEFEYVFLVSCQDEIWGNSGRNNNNRITLPANLAPIRHSGSSEDERLRLFFVALTRAKIGVYLTSHTATYNGKHTKPLKFLDERIQDDGTIVATTLPITYQRVNITNSELPPLKTLELDWKQKHVSFSSDSSLIDLLHDRLSSYQLSPTHLTGFIDLQYGGPHHFFTNTILRFPSAPTTDSQFGNAIHETLQWTQGRVSLNNTLPSIIQITEYFITRLTARKIAEPQLSLETERGERALSAYFSVRGDSFRKEDMAEVNFKHEGVFVGDAHLSGAIDKLSIDTTKKTITVVDYKTGGSHSKWTSDLKLHKYKLQLYCYKILVEESAKFKGYNVDKGRLEFIEPDRETNKIQYLELDYKESEVAETKQLIEALWSHVQSLNFPDVSNYETTLKGTKQFEQDLLEGKI